MPDFGYPVHPACAAFPLLDEEELAALSDDVRVNGLLEPAVISPAGILLDGRNRILACARAGIQIQTRVLEVVDETSWIVSTNLHRRHLTTSQRAMIAVTLLPVFEEEARKRIQATQFGATASADLREPVNEGRGKASEHAARALSVSARAVEAAKVVAEHGTPELVEAVRNGSAAVTAAAEVARMPATAQAVAVAKPDGVAKAAKAAKAAKHRAEHASKVEKRAAEAGAGSRPLVLAEVGGRRYPVLLADPPWRYEFAEADNREIENKYPTLSLDEIKALPVGDVAAEDAVLFLWATSPKLEEAMQVMRAWGFTYRTCMVWVKDRIGMGYYARQRHELLLIGGRGALPVPEPKTRPDSVIEAPRGAHSEKPPIVHELIETMYPEFGRLELFCRDPKAGWAAWGNECAR